MANMENPNLATLAQFSQKENPLFLVSMDIFQLLGCKKIRQKEKNTT
jgi:hypothetical protein